MIMWRVSVWDDALRMALPAAFPMGGFMRLSQTGAEIMSCKQKNEPALQQPVLERFRLCFLSPTCFRSSGQTLLFPEGRLVVESAARASGLPIPELPTQCLQPLCHALKTTEVSFDSFVLTGFTGWCEYRAAPALDLQALLRAMPYTGLGYKTAQGMGAVQVRPTGEKGVRK